MLFFLPSFIRGSIAIILLILNILMVPTLVITFGLIKYLIPLPFWKKFCTKVQNDVLPSVWIDINSAILTLTTTTKWDVQGKGELNNKHWYLVISNHLSWADILVIQKIFNRKIPILKFFLKQELLWVLPLGGLACWMLDFPFMKRYNKAQLKKNPELKLKDIETAKLACNKFKLRPTSVINFLEGTRFTKQKQTERSSPYLHLLRPKSGGIALVTSQLNTKIREIIDVTLLYDHPDPNFWNFISGKVPKVTVRYEVLPIPEELYGDYYTDSNFRKSLQTWVNQRWKQKDNLITKLTIDENVA